MFKAIPYIVVGTFAVGLVIVLVLRMRNPSVYRAIGRTVLEESHERVSVGS